MEDAVLLTQLLKNPQEGCQSLMNEYTGLVLSIVRCRLSGQSPQEHEELVSDILFSFYQKREQIDLARGTIRSLLITMAVRMCIDYYRGKKNAPETEELNEDAVIADSEPNPEEKVIQAEDKSKLIAAIRSLGEPDSSIIIWKYYFGETALTIAERLSMRTGTVEMRISRAKDKLKKLLGGDADGNQD